MRLCYCQIIGFKTGMHVHACSVTLVISDFVTLWTAACTGWREMEKVHSERNSFVTAAWIDPCFVCENKKKTKKQSLSHVWLFVTPWTLAHQAPLSMGFSRQEYWSWLPCPPLEDLPDPEIEPMSPVPPALQVVSLPTEPSLMVAWNICICFPKL